MRQACLTGGMPLKSAETYTHTHTHTHTHTRIILHRKMLSDFPLTPSLLLVLAACGGGGGGGGSRRLVLGPDDAFFVETAASTATHLVYRAVKQESAGPVRLLVADYYEDNILDHYFVTLLSQSTGTVHYVFETGDRVLYDFQFSGVDAGLFEFVSDVGIGRPQRVEADDSLDGPDLVSRAPLDYENPTDQGGDNIYELVIVYTTNDADAISLGLQTLRQTLILEITDDPELGPATIIPADGPPFVRDGDVISLTLNEGETLIYVMEDVTLAWSGLSGVLSHVLAGPDADDVQVRVTDNIGGLYDLLLEFTAAPDFDNPADEGGDNTYDFEFAGLLADTLPLEFQVTVLDMT